VEPSTSTFNRREHTFCLCGSPWRRASVRVFLTALGCLAFTCQPVFAVDKIWTGATNTTWGTNGNWTGNAPAAGDNAVFNSTFANQPNLAGNTSAGGIWMTGSIGQNVTVSASSGTLTLQSNTINGTAGLGILVDNANAFSLTINAPLSLGGAQTWRNNSGNLLTIGAGGVNLNNKALTVDGTGNTTVSGVMSGAGGLTKSGNGTLVLSGTNTYTSGTTINGGIVCINSAASLGNTSGGVTLNAATIEVSAGFSTTRVYTLGNAASTIQVDPSQTFTISSVMGGAGTLNKTGTGTLVLSGANTFSGGTAVNGGTLNLGSSGALNSSGTISFGGGTLQYSASNTTDYSSRFSTAASQAYSIDTNSQNVTLATALTSSGGSLTKFDSGTLTLSAANTYTGGTTLSAGTLKLSGSGLLGSSSGTLSVNGGTLDLNGTTQDVGNLTGSGGTIANNSTGTNVTLTIGNNNGTGGNYAGVIADHTSGTGTVALTKAGTGTITLSGANTYTGGTVVSNGMLLTASAAGNTLGTTSGITVNAGGTLCLGGAADQINNSATITLAGGTFQKGNFSEGTTAGVGMGALTLSASGSRIDFGTGTVGILTFASLNASTFTLTIDNWTGNYNTVGTTGSTDRLIFDSDQTSNLSKFIFTGYGTGGVEFNLGNGYWEVVAAVPEPSTWNTGSLVVGVLGFHQRRRFRRLFSHR
jgi:autotransporter-associated beta strand protein